MRTLLLICIPVVLLIGCSELKQELPPAVAPGVQVHGPEWLDTASAEFHGTVIRNNNGDYQSCLTCHGFDFDGGTSGVSCVTCHQTEGATLHGRGWMNPAATNWHGNAIRNNNWDMQGCKTCHGATYSGGRVNSSCRDCHTGGAGPENCATCHGSVNPAPPRDLSRNTAMTARGVGTHQAHVLGRLLSTGNFCYQCHVTPSAMYTPGHVNDGTPNAEITWGPMAHLQTNEPYTQDYDLSLPLFTPSPSFNTTALTCSNTYCHGHFKNGDTTNVVTWNPDAGQLAAQAACGTCHGDPSRPTQAERALPRTSAQGGTHPNSTACSNCHGDVVNASAQIINRTLHINGRLNVFGTERDF